LRRLLALLCAIAPGLAAAQVPDVVIKLSARLDYRFEPHGSTTLRFYDTLGRHSTVSLGFRLEPGLHAVVSQRLQRIPNDGDPDQIDEYYVEDEGIWRAGKQYLPFGAGALLRESVVAVRGDTNLLFESLPVSVAACDGGPGRQRGFVGRVGGNLGFSAAIGEHFGISGSSLTLIRHPEDSPGKGHGYREAYGADYTRADGMFRFSGELVALRGPNRRSDSDENVFDLSISLRPSKYREFVLGWTHATEQRVDFYRLQGSIYLTNNIFAEPMVRYRNGTAYDFSVIFWVRL
jgi:hypothetical protein